MSSLLAILTYVAYVLIVAMIIAKMIKIVRMPVHLRWRLYPVTQEKGRQYGGSYDEELGWWMRYYQKTTIRGIPSLLKHL